MSERDDNQWHLDKRVPIALILALMVQGGSTIWWGARIDARVATLETRITETAPQETRITRLEVTAQNIVLSLSEMKQDLKQLLRSSLGNGK